MTEYQKEGVTVTDYSDSGFCRYGVTDLHLHLDGSLAPDVILELAKKQGIELPAETVRGLQPFISAPRDCDSLNRYLSCFDVPLLVLQSAEGLSYAAYDLVRRLSALGILYGEIRYAPQLLGKSGMTQEESLRAVLAGIVKAQEEMCKTKVILCCMRGEGNRDVNLETVELAAKYGEKGVAAVDLAGAEGLFPTGDYGEEFALAKKLGVPFTIHAGEAAGAESIWKALEFGARRIGHGVRAREDKELLKELAAKQIPLEMCPSSNVQTKAVTDLASYPLREYLEQGIPVTLNSDNMTVSDTWAGKEFELLHTYSGLTEEEASALVRNAVCAAFLADDEKQFLVQEIRKRGISI